MEEVGSYSRPCGIRRRADDAHELVAEITGENGEMSKGPGATAARRRRERWRTRAHGLVNIPALQDPRPVSVDAGYTTNTCHWRAGGHVWDGGEDGNENSGRNSRSILFQANEESKS